MSENLSSTPKFPFKGVWIPAKVFTDTRLTQSDKFLWSIVHILSNEKGCYATKETLATYMGSSVRNIQYSLSRLAESGLVIRAGGNVWDVVTKALEGEVDCTPTMKNSSPQAGKEFHPNRNKEIDTKKIKEATPPTEDFIRSDSELSRVWDEYLAWRRAAKKSVNALYITRWNEEFKSWGVFDATRAIESSLRNGYQGIFKPQAGMKPRPQAKGPNDHASGF